MYAGLTTNLSIRPIEVEELSIQSPEGSRPRPRMLDVKREASPNLQEGFLQEVFFSEGSVPEGSVQKESVQRESVQKESVQREPVQKEPVQKESVQTDAVQRGQSSRFSDPRFSHVKESPVPIVKETTEIWRTKPFTKGQHVHSRGGVGDKRKLTFSSDDDDDDDFKPMKFETHSPGPESIADEVESKIPDEAAAAVNGSVRKPSKAFVNLQLDASVNLQLDPSLGLQFDTSANQQLDPMVSDTLGETPLNPVPAKRKRGRPRKGEVEKKVGVVTRRSKRVVENPALQKRHAEEAPRGSHPKPFSSMALLLAHRAKADPVRGARPLGLNSKGKKRPLTIDTERLHSTSTRDRRFNLTTLDVLKHFVEEHSPRPSANDVISENVVLTEFKSHLKFYLDHLADLHSSVVDISHDLANVQKKKNEVRRSILQLQKKHSLVGAELSVERRKYYHMKEKHQEFMLMVGAIGDLKAALCDESPPLDLSASVMLSLSQVQRVLNADHGMPAQLVSVVESLKDAIHPSGAGPA